MRNGIWCILLSAQDDKGMDGYTVTAELRRSLDTTITDYYDGIATSSKGSRSVKGFVDDELSKMRTKVYHLFRLVESNENSADTNYRAI